MIDVCPWTESTTAPEIQGPATSPQSTKAIVEASNATSMAKPPRTQMSAAHEREHLDQALAAFKLVGIELGVL